MAHDKFSPSKWPAFDQCLGYTGSDETSGDALRGTLQHEYLEALGTNNESKKIELEAKLTKTEMENVFFVYDKIVEMTKSFPKDFVDAGIFTVEWEQKLTAIGAGFTTVTGTSDVVVFTPSEVWIIDAKFGAIKDYDLQLMVYGLAAMQKYNRRTARCFAVYGQEKTITANIFTLEEALEKFNAMIAKLKHAEVNPDSIVCKTNAWCRYCARNGSCPAIFNSIKEVSTMADVPNTIEGSFDIATCDIDDLGNLCTVLSALEKFTEKAKATLKDRITAGENSSLYKLQSKKGALAIDDIHGLSRSIATLTKKTEAEVNSMLMDHAKFAVGNVRGMIYGSESETNGAKKDFEERFAGFLTRGNDTVSLVKLSAKEIAAIGKE